MKTTVQTLQDTTPKQGTASSEGRTIDQTGAQTIDRVDQLSSVVLLGLAIAGAALAVGLIYLIH